MAVNKGSLISFLEKRCIIVCGTTMDNIWRSEDNFLEIAFLCLRQGLFCFSATLCILVSWLWAILSPSPRPATHTHTLALEFWHYRCVVLHGFGGSNSGREAFTANAFTCLVSLPVLTSSSEVYMPLTTLPCLLCW